MLNEIISIRNKKQPTGGSNTDVVQFDYKFWTELEKIAKKEREKALQAVKNLSDKPDTAGVILASQVFRTVLRVSEPFKTFDKEVFIDEIIKRHPEVPKHSLREAATAAVVDGIRRKTYTVEDM